MQFVDPSQTPSLTLLHERKLRTYQSACRSDIKRQVKLNLDMVLIQYAGCPPQSCV